MELLRLRVFASVAALGSITRAAQVHDTTQSAVSRQVAALEADLGGRLFHRTGRGVTLSPLGKLVEPRIRAVLLELERIAAEAKAAVGIPSGTVFVGMLPTVAPRISAELLRRVRVQFPEVRLHLADGFSGQLHEELADGRLDMALIFRYGEEDEVDDDGESLGVVHSYLVGPAGDALTARPTITFRDLDGVRLVLPPSPNGIRTMLERLAKRYGIALTVLAEVGSIPIQLAIVAESAEPVRIVSSYFAVAEEVACGRLQASRVVSPSIDRTLFLKRGSRRPASLATKEVSVVVAQLARELLVVDGVT